MADNPPAGYSLVPGDGGRSSGLIRRRTADEGGSGCAFLDLSLGSIYNKPSSMADDDGFSAVGSAALLPAVAAPLEASSSAVMPSVVAAATAANALPAPSAFALGLASAAANVPLVQPASRASALTLGPVASAAMANALLAPPSRPSAFTLGLVASAAMANAPLAPPSRLSAFTLGLAASSAANAQLAPAASRASAFALGHASAALPGGDGNGHGPAVFVLADSDSGASRPARRSKGAVALLGASHPSSSVPPPPNRKAPRGRRGIATCCRRRSGPSNDRGQDAAAPANGGESVPPPFPWATKTVGTHPTLAELSKRGITSVEGEVRCKRCDVDEKISYDIRAKFEELSAFIVRNMEDMHDRAPPEWMYPVLLDCDKCGQKNSLRPVIASEKWKINWMFLLLGQTLGLCTLEQLKHFCARTRQHRTGAKDRVLYSTYMELCNQLCPGGPFDMASERKNRTHPFA